MAQTIRRVFPDGDYPQRLSALWGAIEAARKDEQDGKSPDLLAGEVPPSEQLAGEYQALKAEAEKDAESKQRVVVLRAIGRKAWRDLKVAHPPRLKSETVDEDTATGDRLAGVNADTVEDDLVYASIEEPEFSSRGAFDEWADTALSEGEFKVLLLDAWSLVNRAQFDPKSLPASRSQRSDTN
jgi:hypothetical protein